jgi:hypothetical protein
MHHILNEVEICNRDESLRFRCGDLEFVMSIYEVSGNEDLLSSLRDYFESIGSNAKESIKYHDLIDESQGIHPMSRRLNGGETAYRLDCAMGKYNNGISFSKVLWESYLGYEVPDEY